VQGKGPDPFKVDDDLAASAKGDKITNDVGVRHLPLGEATKVCIRLAINEEAGGIFWIMESVNTLGNKEKENIPCVIRLET
jgi:hypothetical protein